MSLANPVYERQEMVDADERVLRIRRQQRILWMAGPAIVALFFAWLLPPLAPWILAVALPLIWAIAFSICPNPVKYATVFLVAGAMLAAIAAPSLLRARERARVNTAKDRLRSQGEAFQKLQMLKEGGSPPREEPPQEIQP